MYKNVKHLSLTKFIPAVTKNLHQPGIKVTPNTLPVTALHWCTINYVGVSLARGSKTAMSPANDEMLPRSPTVPGENLVWPRLVSGIHMSHRFLILSQNTSRCSSANCTIGLVAGTHS